MYSDKDRPTTVNPIEITKEVNSSLSHRDKAYAVYLIEIRPSQGYPNRDRPTKINPIETKAIQVYLIDIRPTNVYTYRDRTNTS